jgi:hypothetical protein
MSTKKNDGYKGMIAFLETPMGKKILIAAALVVVGVPATTQTKCDLTSTNPICKLPQLGTSMASGGYVSGHGTWTPDGLINKADIEIECLRTPIAQISFSKIGVCQMASANVLGDQPVVALNDFDIVAWEKTKIIAERSATWQMQNCETQQLVLDFPSNTVTLTSTLSRSGRCAKLYENSDKLAKNMHQQPLKDVEVFTLVHNLGALYADEDDNPFFHLVK